MLIPYNELSEEDKGKCLAGWIALDPSSGDYLKIDKPPQDDKRGMYILLTGHKMAIPIFAYSDQEAIEKANQGWL